MPRLNAEALKVLHADNHLLVVWKPACVPSVPDESGDPSLLDLAKEWVRLRYDKPGNVFLGVVHRLDRPVSGVLVFARTSKAASRLTDAFRRRTVEKLYWGISGHAPDTDSGVVEHWLHKDRERNRVRVVEEGHEGAKLARTQWRVLSASKGRVHFELKPETGRPHQLRVAVRSLGCVLAGDLKYGADEPLSDGSIALHARSLSLIHPTTKERLRFVADTPDLGIWRGL